MKSLLLRLFVLLPIPWRRRVTWLGMSTYTVGVSGIVVDGEGRVLLLRHRFRESSGWQLPGGFVERGESLHVALKRELREEVGLEVDVRRVVDAGVERALHIDISFLATIKGGELAIDTGELLDARFFTPAELESILRRGQGASIYIALQDAARLREE